MSWASPSDPLLRLLDEAEGYLMLDLPERSLAILESRASWGRHEFAANFLRGEALRQTGRLREALAALERASRIEPGNVAVAIALGWCYKRTHRLAQAIDALEQAVLEHPDEPLVHYNLACYWSLAGRPEPALLALGRAIGLDTSLAERLASEPDFDSLRTHPTFIRLSNLAS